MTFVIGLNFFFFIIVFGFIMGGICLSQQKVKKTAVTSQSPSYQPQPAVQQTAPSTPAPPPPQPVKELEKAKFCPHCGSPATDNFCKSCGVKID